MILSLFVFLTVLSLSLICVGLWKFEHSELALIGFLFLFLLSFTLLNSQLQIKNGENITETYTYNENSSNVAYTDSVSAYNYDYYGSHMIGFWMAVSSVIGVIIIIVSLKKNNWGRGEE